MPKTMMFINPKAGQLNGFTGASEIKARLQAHGLAPELYLAKSWRGMSAFITRVKQQQPDSVIIAGGDGTIGTIIKGLIGQPVKFGLIPTGSVNNIAGTVNIPSELDDALEVIKANKTQKIDAGRAGGRYFLEAVGVGLIARIFDATDWDKDKKIMQMVTRTAAEMIGPESIKAKLLVDGKPLDIETVWMTIGNNCKVGTLTLDPHSKINDGYLDLVYCKPLGLKELPVYAAKFLKSTHLELDKFESIRAKKIEIKFAAPHRVHFDDQVSKRRQVTIEVIPKAVELCAPSGN